MRYGSARQMIFDAYQSRRGNSPIAGLFDDLRRIREKTGNNGAKLRSLIAQHKRNVRALMNAGPFDADLEEKQATVRRTERRLSEVRTALEDVSKSSNEGHLPDNDWKIVHGLECGQVIAAVERLPQHLQAMARYCWGPFTPEELAEDREWLHAALVSAMQRQRLPGQGHNELPPADSVRTLQALCWAAVYHHSQVTYPYNRPGLHSPKRIQRWLEEERGELIDVHRWSRAGRLSWSDVWRRMLTILDDWESQALGPVAALIPEAA